VGWLRRPTAPIPSVCWLTADACVFHSGISLNLCLRTVVMSLSRHCFSISCQLPPHCKTIKFSIDVNRWETILEFDLRWSRYRGMVLDHTLVQLAQLCLCSLSCLWLRREMLIALPQVYSCSRYQTWQSLNAWQYEQTQFFYGWRLMQHHECSLYGTGFSNLWWGSP